MLDLLHAVPHRPHSHGHIWLNAGFRSDLAWWKAFLAQWNGISYLPPPSFLPQLNLYFTTDASGSWGCGAWHGTSWFKLKWDSRAHHLGIAEKELIPIVIACFIWGNPWYGHQIRCYCDNQAIVACLHSRTSKQKAIMHLLRCLLFVEAQRNCNLTPAYISTEANHLADDLSRDHLSSFFSKVPQANPHPTPVPPPLLIPTQLQFPRPSWTSYWTPQPTGHQKHGAVSSALLQEGSSPLDSENIFRRPQTLLFILHTLHRYQPLPTIRTLTVLLRSSLGRSGP